MKKNILDEQLLAQVYAETDREAAEDVLTEQDIDDLYRIEKSRPKGKQGHSRYDEDGDLPVYI